MKIKMCERFRTKKCSSFPPRTRKKPLNCCLHNGVWSDKRRKNYNYPCVIIDPRKLIETVTPLVLFTTMLSLLVKQFDKMELNILKDIIKKHGYERLNVEKIMAIINDYNERYEDEKEIGKKLREIKLTKKERGNISKFIEGK